MEKRIIFLGNYYNGIEGCTGSVYHSKGVKPCINAVDKNAGKGLVLRRFKGDKTNNVGSVGQQRI